MDSLTILIVNAFVAAATQIIDDISEIPPDVTLNNIRLRLVQWRNLKEHSYIRAFDEAMHVALGRLNTELDATSVERVLLLLREDSPNVHYFRRIAIEEFVLSARPNIGRLLDIYRRDLRFNTLLRGVDLPPWLEVGSVLHLLLRDVLPDVLTEHKVLHVLLITKDDLMVLDDARQRAYLVAESTANLDRIRTLLEEMTTLPRISQSINSVDGSTATNTAQTIVLGNYYATQNLPTPSLETLYRRYRGFLVETFAMLDFRGIMQIRNVVRLRLEDVYVSLKGQVDAQQFPALLSSIVHEESEAFEAFQQDFSYGITSLHHIVRDIPFLVVLGDPGAGKSTLVRYIMLTLIECRAYERLGIEGSWLPILFPIAAFAEARSEQGNHDLAPLEYLSKYYKGLSQPDYGPLFQRALLSGHALVLLDGLDEVRVDRLDLVRCLEAFVREWDAPGNRFIATSRINGYDDAPLDEHLFLRAIVQPLDNDDIHKFTKQWSRAFECAGAQDLPTDPLIAQTELERRTQMRSSSLNEAVFANKNVTDLARNPLLLTILALIHNQGTRLPNRRVDLYRLCVEALAETWNRARSLSGREIDVYLGTEKLDERFVVNLLGPAALWIHSEQPGGLVERGDLERQLADILVKTDGLVYGKAQRLAADFIDLVRRHTGLLQERAYRRFGFLHLTFEEYLAARALLESGAVNNSYELIHEYCDDPGWREVIRLTVASASQREAQRLLLHLLAAPTTEKAPERAVILAAECLLDIGSNNATRHAWNAVAKRLVELLAIPTSRSECSRMLERLENPHLLDPTMGDAAIGGYWCQVDAGSFWFGDDLKEQLKQLVIPYAYKIGRYPVTNAEFAHFIEDNGYQDERWWTEQGLKFLKPGGHPYDDQKQQIAVPRRWYDADFNSQAQPVVGVSWFEAMAYCSWLTAQGHTRGWLPSNAKIRLPMAIEWERAARHQDKRLYPWGDAVPTVDRANYARTGIGKPTPVGCFPNGAAVCGTMDMIGNVWEWAAAEWEEVETPELRNNFITMKTSSVRGGSFNVEGDNLHCGSRDWIVPNYRNNNRGFRILWCTDLSDNGPCVQY